MSIPFGDTFSVEAKLRSEYVMWLCEQPDDVRVAFELMGEAAGFRAWLLDYAPSRYSDNPTRRYWAEVLSEEV